MLESALIGYKCTVNSLLVLSHTDRQNVTLWRENSDVSISNVSNYHKDDAKISKKKEIFFGCLVLIIT